MLKNQKKIKNIDTVFVNEKGEYTSQNLEVEEIKEEQEISEILKAQTDDANAEDLKEIGEMFLDDEAETEIKKPEEEVQKLETEKEVRKTQMTTAVKKTKPKAFIKKSFEEKNSETLNESTQESEVEEVEKKEESSVSFGMAKELKIKPFNPLVNFVKILKSMQNDEVLDDVSLMFLLKDKIYISGEFLFMSILKNYTLNESEFSEDFLINLKRKIKPFTKNKEAEIESRELFIPKLNKKVVSSFLVIEANAISKKIGEEFMEKLLVRKNLKEYTHDEIDLISFLNRRAT